MTTDRVRMALLDAVKEAYWRREYITESGEDAEISVACIISEFLRAIPADLQVGTLLAAVERIAKG